MDGWRRRREWTRSAQPMLTCKFPPPETWLYKCVIHALRVRSNPDLRSLAFASSLRKGSHPPSAIGKPPFTAKITSNRKTTREGGWMEAEAGIEPANVGFANRCLTTWPLRLDETSSCCCENAFAKRLGGSGDTEPCQLYNC